MPVAFEDLLCGSVHRVSVSQVEGDGAGSVSLLLEQNKAVSPWIISTTYSLLL